MPRLSATLLLILAATFTFAQAPDHNASTAIAAQNQAQGEIAPAAGCPVGFFANRQADTTLISVDRDTRQKDGPTQGLHLMLNHLNRPAIQSIEVTVYGTSLKPRALPVAPPSENLISKTFELHRTTGSDSLSEADVWMHQVGSVRWADLISITYTDGATWHAAPTLKCRAVLSNFLLVGSK
jgi:hypothetical protein